MVKLLSLYNIKTVQFIDNNAVERKYSFSDKMLANSIFIEYFTNDPFDFDEAADAESEEMEEDFDEGDSDEDDFDEDALDEGDFGSSLSVIMKHRRKYYEFLMYHNTNEIGTPVLLLQTIIFLVKLIEEAEPDQLIEYLTSLSVAPLIPHEIEDKRFQEAARKMIKLKIQTVEELIQGNKANLN